MLTGSRRFSVGLLGYQKSVLIAVKFTMELMMIVITLVLSIHLRQAFYLISVAKFVHYLARTKKLHSVSGASLFLFNVSFLCFCTTLSPRTVRTNRFPDLINFLFLTLGINTIKSKKQEKRPKNNNSNTCSDTVVQHRWRRSHSKGTSEKRGVEKQERTHPKSGRRHGTYPL